MVDFSMLLCLIMEEEEDDDANAQDGLLLV